MGSRFQRHGTRRRLFDQRARIGMAIGVVEQVGDAVFDRHVHGNQVDRNRCFAFFWKLGLAGEATGREKVVLFPKVRNRPQQEGWEIIAIAAPADMRAKDTAGR